MANELVIDSIGIDAKKFDTYKYMTYAINQTFTYANNSLFYAMISPNYQDYYSRVVKINFEWYDGYVQGLHSYANGISSTRIATAIVDGIIGDVFSHKIMFDKGKEVKDYKVVDFFSEWSKKHHFIEDIKTLAKYSGASGTSLLKLNSVIDGDKHRELWVQTLRQDQFIYETDCQGNITSITMFMKPYEKLGNEGLDNYYVIEKRFFSDSFLEPTEITMLDKSKKIFYKPTDKRVGLVQYKVLYYHGNVFNNSMASGINTHSLMWYDLPKGIREKIKKDYGDIYFDTQYQLPFGDDSLGCFLLQINGKDTTITTGNFGASFLTNIRSSLVKYELINAFSGRDRYNAQGQVGIPKALTKGDFDGSVFNADKSNYETFPGDPDKQKPIITQFELRAQEWEIDRENCLREMAAILHMSPKVIASYLDINGGNKTATEVVDDRDSSDGFINDKCDNLITFLNPIIGYICRFYGYQDPITARFLGTKSNPTSQQQKDIMAKYQGGFITLRRTLRELYPTVSEQELDVLESEAKKRQEEIKAEQTLQINELGDYEE